MFYSKTQGSISNELYCPFSATHTFSERLPCVEKVQKTGNNTNFGILLLLFESQFCLSLLCGMTSLSLSPLENIRSNDSIYYGIVVGIK